MSYLPKLTVRDPKMMCGFIEKKNGDALVSGENDFIDALLK